MTTELLTTELLNIWTFDNWTKLNFWLLKFWQLTFYNWTFDKWTFDKWTFDNWTFDNWTLDNWTLDNGTFDIWRSPRVLDVCVSVSENRKNVKDDFSALSRIRLGGGISFGHAWNAFFTIKYRSKIRQKTA